MSLLRGFVACDAVDLTELRSDSGVVSDRFDRIRFSIILLVILVAISDRAVTDRAVSNVTD